MSPFWIALAMAGCFAVGLLFGILLHKVTSPSLKKRRRIESQIDQIRDEYMRYQAGVTQHFSESAALVKRLDQDYQAVIAHLTRGAGKLSADPELDGREMQSRLGSTASGSTESSLSDSPGDNYATRNRTGDQLTSPADSANPANASSGKVGASSVKVTTQNQPADFDALQVPGVASSSIQGVKIAGKHVTSADYDEQHVDGYVQAPRDYAPRRGPEDNGTLAETYGLDRGGVKH